MKIAWMFVPLLAVIALALTTATPQTRGEDLRAVERAQPSYDFRNSPAYRALSEGERRRLEQVHRDLLLLRGAIEVYADTTGAPPDRLGDLTPVVLQELPVDPFATEQTASGKATPGYEHSLGGYGYQYRRGIGRSWIVASAGLPGIPYLAAEGNVGLYAPVGTWISGTQPMLIIEDNGPQ